VVEVGVRIGLAACSEERLAPPASHVPAKEERRKAKEGRKKNEIRRRAKKKGRGVKIGEDAPTAT